MQFSGLSFTRLLTAIIVTLLPAVGFAQGTINAQITGGGGNGKCTFEIRTGGVANVMIRGDQGKVQAVSGGPAQWVRLKCNQPLPRNPNNFRFAGVDGRGRQELLQSPNNNNGTAVVRITDNRGGMQGYTGDIMWNGGSDGGGNGNDGGWGNNGGGNNQWPGGGGSNWSNNIVPNCQRAIRNKLVPQYGGNMTFKGTPSKNQAGPFVMVQGRATYKDGRGQVGELQYNCTMHPNGNVADSSYKVLNGTFQGGPQPR